jgi:hypothetical protein
MKRVGKIGGAGAVPPAAPTVAPLGAWLHWLPPFLPRFQRIRLGLLVVENAKVVLLKTSSRHAYGVAHHPCTHTSLCGTRRAKLGSASCEATSGTSVLWASPDRTVQNGVGKAAASRALTLAVIFRPTECLRRLMMPLRPATT